MKLILAGSVPPGVSRRGRGTLYLAAMAAALSGCGGASARTEAHIACRHVAASLATLRHPTGAAQSSEQRSRALVELRQALPPAAQAAAQSPRYGPLATTLSESNRVPEQRLIHALRAECSNPGPTQFPTLKP